MSKIDPKEELLQKLRSHLFDTHEQAMYQIYQSMLQDSKMSALLELEVISEFDYLEVIEDTFRNLQEFIVENPDHYDN
jgi:hypothetical protein